MTNVTSPTASKKILIVDDHPIVRHGLRRLIEVEEGLSVCAEAGDAHETLALIEKQGAPDLIILDLFLKGSPCIGLIKELRETHPNLPILVISMNTESLYVERALEAGADGYLLKEEFTGPIVKAIRKVMEGRGFVTGKIWVQMFRRVAEKDLAPGKPRAVEERLSDRELQVFHLVAEGANSRRIALELHLSVKTIETHYARIKKKLGLSSVSELIRYAACRVSPDKEAGFSRR